MTADHHHERKAGLRKQVLCRLKDVTPEQLDEASRKIRRSVTDYLRMLEKSRGIDAKPLKIAIFAAHRGEVDLVPLVTDLPAMEWYFPRCIGPREMVFQRITSPITELAEGFKCLREPLEHLPIAEPDELDVIITPGLAFSREGHRLGKGGSFYDGFFKKAPQSIRIGVCLPCQLCDDVPMSEHDEMVHEVIVGE